MPPAEKLVGRCARRHQGLCTYRANFHLHLANLGKTNISTDLKEQELIPQQYQQFIQPHAIQGQIFVWEISQLQPDKTIEGQQRNAQFRKDLQQFLHLDNPLPEMIWIKPGYDHSINATIKEQITSKKIDICEDRYQTLRNILVQQGILASKWIREYFLQADGVVVSQKEYFSNVILKSWEQDPCLHRTTTTSE